jgi:hypothetical protein
MSFKSSLLEIAIADQKLKKASHGSPSDNA